MFKFLKLITLSCFLLFCLTGCSEDKKASDEKTTSQEESSSQDVKKPMANADDNTLVVGTSADYFPFEFIKNNEIVGFDIDLIKAIADKLNMQILIRDMAFYSLLPSLENGDLDIAVAGLAETPERAKTMDFSKPYYFNKFSLLMTGNYDENDPIKAGMKIGVQTATVMHQWLEKQGLDINIIAVNKNLDLIEALKSNQVDGILMDDLSAREMISLNAGMNIAIVNLNGISVSGVAIALQKNSRFLRDVNQAITELEESGEMQTLKGKWGL